MSIYPEVLARAEDEIFDFPKFLAAARRADLVHSGEKIATEGQLAVRDDLVYDVHAGEVGFEMVQHEGVQDFSEEEGGGGSNG